jgi:hypothetical protein
VLSRLAAYAQRTGKTVNDLLQEMLDEREAATQSERRSFLASATSDEWARELRAWAASHPVSTVIADGSRESIYSGRSERFDLNLDELFN